MNDIWLCFLKIWYQASDRKQVEAKMQTCAALPFDYHIGGASAPTLINRDCSNLCCESMKLFPNEGSENSLKL